MDLEALSPVTDLHTLVIPKRHVAGVFAVRFGSKVPYDTGLIPQWLSVDNERHRAASKLGYNSPAALRAAWSTVTPYIGDALANLQMTQEGKVWVASLYSYFFTEEHKLPALGAERKRTDRG
jgi:hypothetical protein